MANDLTSIAVTVGGVAVSQITSCNVEQLLGEEEITQDDDTSVRRTWTIKDGNCDMEYMYDPTPDAGQEDIQDLMDGAPDSDPTTTLVVVKGTITYTMTAFPKSISDPKGPAENQRQSVTWAVTGGIART